MAKAMLVSDENTDDNDTDDNDNEFSDDYECLMCGFRSQIPDDEVEHSQAMHTRQVVFECFAREKRFITRRELEEHDMREHLDVEI